MARPFNVNEAQDLDLNTLVNRFLETRPDFLPLTASDGSLVLLPYDESWELEKHFQVCSDKAEVAELLEQHSVRTAMLM